MSKPIKSKNSEDFTEDTINNDSGQPDISEQNTPNTTEENTPTTIDTTILDNVNENTKKKKINWMLAIIFIPFSQILYRILELGGSMDQLWTLIPIFQIPPLSLIPALLILFNLIKKEDNNPLPYSYWTLVPVIVKFILISIDEFTKIKNVDDKYPDSSGFGKFKVILYRYIGRALFRIIMTFGIIFFSFDSRMKKQCGNKNNSSNINTTKLRNILLTNTMLAHSMSNILTILFFGIPIIGHIVNFFFNLLVSSNYTIFRLLKILLHSSLWGSHYLFTFGFINMLTGMDYIKHCSGKRNVELNTFIIYTSIVLYFLSELKFLINNGDP